MARKKSKGTELDVLIGKAVRANLAIFDALSKETPLTIRQLRNRIIKYKGLEETYYDSLTKRLHCLQNKGYVGEANSKQERLKAQAYELRTKAYLAMLLKEYNIQDIL